MLMEAAMERVRVQVPGETGRAGEVGVRLTLGEQEVDDG